MIRKFHNRTLQTNPWHREEEPQNNYNHEIQGRQRKYSNRLSLLHQDDFKQERTQSNAQQNTEQAVRIIIGATINNESTTTEPPP